MSESTNDTEKSTNLTNKSKLNSSTSSNSLTNDDEPTDFHGDSDIESQIDDINLQRVESLSESKSISKVLTNTPSLKQINSEYNTPIPLLGEGKEVPLEFPDPEPYTVSFIENDPIHPHNWPLKKKLITCICLGINTAAVTWGSTIYSPDIRIVADKYHVGTTVATLGISLYVLGFACGPVIWAPLSELFGRKIVLLLSCFTFTCLQFATATGKDLQTILLGRAFSGMLGSAPLAVVPAAFADMFDNQTRGKAITIFSMTVFCMPIIAPIAGSFIVYSYLSWRWTEYISGMFSSLGLCLLYFYEESHHPIILVHKAKEIKKRTGNWLIHAPHDEFELNFRDILENNISGPLKMLFTEPIILLISIYNSFIYGILYMLLSAYPIVFAEGYGMHGGVAELPYLALTIGMTSGGCYCFFCEGKYLKALKENNGKPVPEARLYPLFAGSIAFPIGLLWFTWTGNYHEKVHWMAPTAAGVFIGFGLITIFNSSINYIVDSYLIFAASALAGNTFLRSASACAFPLFSVQMFHNMGVNWAGLMLGLFGIILIPVPVLFFKYGKQIRGKSKYAFVLT